MTVSLTHWGFYSLTRSNLAPPANSGQTLPDSEYFCLFRSGSDFPSSLANPYPDQYAEPAVFEKASDSSGSSGSGAIPAYGIALIAVACVLVVAFIIVFILRAN